MRAILRRERRIEKFHPGAKNIDRDGEKLCIFLGKNLFETSLFVSSPLDVLIFREFSFLRDYRKKTKKKKRKGKSIAERKGRLVFLIKARYDPSAVRGTSVHQNLPHELRQAGQINRDIYMRAEQSRNF